MVALIENREKLDCTQEEFASCILIERHLLSKVELGTRSIPSDVLNRWTPIRDGIQHIDAEGIVTPESLQIIEDKKVEAYESLRMRRRDVLQLLQRQKEKHGLMISKYNRVCKALNYSCWLVHYSNDSSDKTKDWMQWKTDVATKDLEKFGFLEQTRLETKISNLELELSKLDLILG